MKLTGRLKTFGPDYPPYWCFRLFALCCVFGLRFIGYPLAEQLTLLRFFYGDDIKSATIFRNKVSISLLVSSDCFLARVLSELVHCLEHESCF